MVYSDQKYYRIELKVYRIRWNADDADVAGGIETSTASDGMHVAGGIFKIARPVEFWDTAAIGVVPEAIGGGDWRNLGCRNC